MQCALFRHTHNLKYNIHYTCAVMTLPSSSLLKGMFQKCLIQVWQMAKQHNCCAYFKIFTKVLQKFAPYFRELIKLISAQLAAEAKVRIIRFQERIHHR